MIVDVDLYKNTSHGSAARILCRCDKCGVERTISKQKLVQRGDNYEHCRECYYSRNGSMSRAYIKSECLECGVIQGRRADAVKVWSGRCASCARKEVAARPEVKAVLRQNGLKTPPPVRRGQDSHMWRGGATPEVLKVRGSAEMKQWRSNVFARDDFTCTCCGVRGGMLEVDHILPFSLYPELRFSVFNGRTMCKPCHRAFGARVLSGRQIREARFPSNDIWRIG